MSPLADVLDAVARFVRRFVVLTAEQCDALALWVTHTHAIEASDATPYLWITSPAAESGKTRTLETLALLVRNPWFTGRVSPAVLVRKIAAVSPTLLLDEADAAFGSGEEYAEALRGVLNTGHRRGGQVSVCVGQGAKITYADFATFAPKALAGLRRLPDTVESRSIPLRLKRKAPGEVIEKFRRRDVEVEAAPLCQWLKDWAPAAVSDLREARPHDARAARRSGLRRVGTALCDRQHGGWGTGRSEPREQPSRCQQGASTQTETSAFASSPWG